MTECRAAELKRVVYGPVSSWRLGRSLGIDLLSRPKTCSFDCIYCQLGRSQHKLTARAEFVPTSRVAAELEALADPEAEVVTFSGMGEPTLAANLGEAIVKARDCLRRPVAVLTNSSLVSDPEVRAELALADLVVAKLDAPDEFLFREINRPADGVAFGAMVEGLRGFQKEYEGQLAIQVMFCRNNQRHAGKLAALIAGLGADEVQLNTPLRPSSVPPLSPEEMREIEGVFVGLPVISVYDARKVAVKTLDPEETAARRPEPKVLPGGRV